jgi:hypothetical protein
MLVLDTPVDRILFGAHIEGYIYAEYLCKWCTQLKYAEVVQHAPLSGYRKIADKNKVKHSYHLMCGVREMY